MSRWPPDAAARLHHAAIELFLEQGFAVTTVPQIAARAGLGTRSFFRHYADKREVLFTGEDELPGVVARMFAAAPAGLDPMDVVRHGFREVLGPRLERLRPELLARRHVVEADEGLRERQLRKLEILQEAVGRAFLARGLPARDAELAGRLGVMVFDTALDRWLDDDARSFPDVADEIVDALPRLSRTGPDTAH